MLVLLDRDGVINQDLPTGVTTAEQFCLIPGSAAAIARLNREGLKVAVVTNQSVVGKGLISHAELDVIHTHLKTLLAQEGAHLDAVYACTDHPDKPTEFRKPGAGMLRQALTDFNENAANTPMIGDALRDLQAAQAAGCARYLVRTGKGAKTEADPALQSLQPVAILDDLAEAVDHWLQRAAKLL